MAREERKQIAERREGGCASHEGAFGEAGARLHQLVRVWGSGNADKQAARVCRGGGSGLVAWSLGTWARQRAHRCCKASQAPRASRLCPLRRRWRLQLCSCHWLRRRLLHVRLLGVGGRLHQAAQAIPALQQLRGWRTGGQRCCWGRLSRCRRLHTGSCPAGPASRAQHDGAATSATTRAATAQESPGCGGARPRHARPSPGRAAA